MTVIYDKKTILEAINSGFPEKTKMPLLEESLSGAGSAGEKHDTLIDISEINESRMNFDDIVSIHQSLPILSDKFILWLLPHYLRVCMKRSENEARCVIERLLFFLSPDNDDIGTRSAQVGLLNTTQLNTLAQCIKYWLSLNFWKGFYGDELLQAKTFVSTEIELRIP